MSYEIEEALATRLEDERTVTADVHAGWEVYGIPHGGYLAALAGAAALTASAQPDLFSITIHYLRKAAVGPIRFEIEPVGSSRRFHSLHARAIQGDRTVLSILAKLGDREGFDGPQWSAAPAWNPRTAKLAPPAVSGPPPALPAIAERMKLRIDLDTFNFSPEGDRSRTTAELRASVEASRVDQLTALIACDVTAPAIWTVLGAKGWVPTVELTAHVRGRPCPGPMGVVASSTQVGGGFLEEDALVHDAEGQLIVQSRQLACWTGA
ncbi:thioesterase family protein [Pseudenhygromyxa sp. WMMC2535]|uniref:thioesterase family protein n=1 Tax=Pseudenhygromyxa sp. WMMC2535 TaxID=2712867 RepID=UPI00155404CB|nr:thioesterase family protein [Pseudenhygromyxa sp. WMMC2535]NVB42466.1 thioesterase family protein [Pseudenhygromyxa sp. WMMC2535]